MPDEKRYTERDLICAKREAFERGAEMVFRQFAIHADVTHWRGTTALAAEAYPLPKITRPRVVMDPHDSMIAYRLVGGNFEYCVGSGPWKGMDAIDEQWSRENYVSPKRVALWAALLANPTEEVDDDA